MYMNNFIISSESACDLTKEQIEKNNFKVASMNFRLGNKDYNSNDNITTKEICEKMLQGENMQTFQINEYEAKEYLTKLLEEGKDILHISFSSAMSGTYNNFKKVSEELNKTSKNKIYVVDSLCQSLGLGLLMILANEESNKNNWNIHECIKFIEDTKLHIAHSFTVDTLKFLAKGGRIPPTLALVGNLINLKPILHLSNEGKITQQQKVIGRRKSLNILIEKFKENFNGKFNKLFISESNSLDDANLVANIIKKDFPNLEIVINELGPVIVSHSGPGVIAMYYSVDNR